jgi:broad specificity phosphatase PhoE
MPTARLTSRLTACLFGAMTALSACATAAPVPAGPDYYVMRHLQKEAGQDPALTAEGRANAERLAQVVGANPPAVIYVSTTRRARETAAPLAARLHIVPKDYDPADTPALIARVKAETGTVLIVGHSNTVPDIVEQLGGARPAALADGDFGDVWAVYRGGRTERRR